MTKALLRRDYVNQIFTQCIPFIPFDRCYMILHAMPCHAMPCHAIYIVFTYFASFTVYEDDIFKVNSNIRVQIYKSEGEINKLRLFCRVKVIANPFS